MVNTNTDAVTMFDRMVKQECKPAMGLLSFFESRSTNIFNGQNVEFDLVKNRRLVSPAKLRGTGTNLNGSEVFRNRTFTPPLYKEARNYNIANFAKRIAGSDIYDNTAKEALIAQKSAEDVGHLRDKITRAKSLQAKYIFETGAIPFSTSGLSKEGVEDLDFDAPTAHFADLTGGSGSLYWDDASADPLGDMTARIRLIQKDGCTKVRNVLMGYSAWENFRDNSKIQALLDNRRITLGDMLINEREASGLALEAQMVIAGTRVSIWTYEDWYLNPVNNTDTLDYMDPKKVIFIGDGDYQIYHAGIDVIKGISDPRILSFLGTNAVRSIGDRMASAFYVDTYEGNDNSDVNIRVQESALLVPRTNDTFGAMQVLA